MGIIPALCVQGSRRQRSLIGTSVDVLFVCLSSSRRSNASLSFPFVLCSMTYAGIVYSWHGLLLRRHDCMAGMNDDGSWFMVFFLLFLRAQTAKARLGCWSDPKRTVIIMELGSSTGFEYTTDT